MNPLKLTVFAVHVETNETGARIGVVTLTGDIVDCVIRALRSVAKGGSNG